MTHPDALSKTTTHFRNISTFEDVSLKEGSLNMFANET